LVRFLCSRAALADPVETKRTQLWADPFQERRLFRISGAIDLHLSATQPKADVCHLTAQVKTMKTATRPQFHRLRRILQMIREGTRTGSLPRERVWHPSQQLRERRDGSLELRLETSGRKELTRWILSWMPHVKVLAPRQLQDRVRQRMSQGLARYR
jgi:predicted DNA-binding transcriptional regulator YafY